LPQPVADSAKDFSPGGVFLSKEQLTPKPMTKRILLLAGLLALHPAYAQTPVPAAPPAPVAPPPPGESFNTRLQKLITKSTETPEPVVLTKFSLDFRGGPPKQLVTAIEKAMGKPLNAIIPPEHADVPLPPLKMSNVDVRQLFQALELTSQKTETRTTGGFPNSYQQYRTSYGFRTQGQISDESIWYFYVEKPIVPPAEVRTPPEKICRYFSLAPYLERGQTVDDITTAIQTGWKMLGEEETPKISFHKETKLLIAVGEPAKLEIIDDVLKALKSAPATAPFIDPATGLPVLPPAGLPQRALKTAPPASKP
jgi:hypothetical protein